MERYTMFLDWKNPHFENDYTAESNLQIPCNPYQTTNGIFYRTRTKNFIICMETQKTPHCQSDFLKKYLYWSIIAFQWCVSFCFITKWISYTYTYIPISPASCVSLPPSLYHPSRWSQSTELISRKHSAMRLLPTSYFTFGSIYKSMPLSYFDPAYPSPTPLFWLKSC